MKKDFHFAQRIVTFSSWCSGGIKRNEKPSGGKIPGGFYLFHIIKKGGVNMDKRFCKITKSCDADFTICVTYLSLRGEELYTEYF